MSDFNSHKLILFQFCRDCTACSKECQRGFLEKLDTNCKFLCRRKQLRDTIKEVYEHKAHRKDD
jgi:hypothetical protein